MNYKEYKKDDHILKIIDEKAFNRLVIEYLDTKYDLEASFFCGVGEEEIYEFIEYAIDTNKKNHPDIYYIDDVKNQFEFGIKWIPKIVEWEKWNIRNT